MGATIIGSGVNVTTGVGVVTQPASSPVSIYGDGSYSDSYWNLASTTLVPDNLGFKVGLGVVDDGSFTDHFLLYDAVANEIKKIDGSSVGQSSHTQAWSTITGTPTTLSGYGIVDQLQPLDADLTAIAALGYSSTSFLKKTAANTWALDTNTYSVTGHTHAGYANSSHTHTSADLPIATTGALGLVQAGSGITINGSGVISVTPGGGSVAFADITGAAGDNTSLAAALALKAPLAAPVFTTSFGFATSGWRFVANGTSLEITYNGTVRGILASDGTLTVDGDVVAYG